MSDLRTAARLALEALEMQEDGRADAKRILRSALAIMKPEITPDKSIPHEAQTEAEKIAYCAGWWDALAKKRLEEEK